MDQMRNCKRCGRLFNYKGYTNVCHLCHTNEEEEFKKIKDYLCEHPFAKIFEVSINLDIPVDKLKRYLREGRLEIVEKHNAFLLCEKCGKPIQSGSYCDDCFKQSNHGIKVIYTGTGSSGSRINYKKNAGGSLKKAASRY